MSGASGNSLDSGRAPPNPPPALLLRNPPTNELAGCADESISNLRDLRNLRENLHDIKEDLAELVAARAKFTTFLKELDYIYVYSSEFWLCSRPTVASTKVSLQGPLSMRGSIQ